MTSTTDANTDVTNKSNKFLTEMILTKNYGAASVHSYPDNDNCVICADSMLQEAAMILPCGHTYHTVCLVEMIVDHKYKICPDCNKELQYINSKNITIHNGDHDEIHYGLGID